MVGVAPPVGLVRRKWSEAAPRVLPTRCKLHVPKGRSPLRNDTHTLTRVAHEDLAELCRDNQDGWDRMTVLS